MQRPWEIQPDYVARTVEGDVPAISQNALAKAACDLAIMLDHAGGVGIISTMRKRTLVPGECVTTKAMVQWQDRTDAKPQPERIAAPEAVAAALAPHNGEANGAAFVEDGPAAQSAQIVYQAPHPQRVSEQAAANTAAAADQRGELDEHEEPDPVVPAADNATVEQGGQPLPSLERLAQQREQAAASGQSGARIMTPEETAATRRGISAEDDLVDEQDVPPRLRG